MRIAYVTNNSSRTPQAVAEQLQALGLPARATDVVTSAHAAARLVVERFGGPVRVLVVGGEGLRDALVAVGCVPVSSADDRPDAVVQGYDPELRYRDLAEAALAVSRGAWWVATNRDLTLPTERGLQPGNGALVGAVKAAVGHDPAVFAGKPDAALLEEARRRTSARRPVAVGDRLDTDVEGAARAGVDSLLVLTGVSTGADLLLAGRSCRPTYVALDLGGLLTPHPAPVAEDGQGGARWRCGRWAATVDGDAITVHRSRRPGADEISSGEAGADGTSADETGPGADEAGSGAADLLRAAAAAAWVAADAGHAVRQVVTAPEDRDVALAAGLERLLPAGAPPVR
jgi:HAD superfamily hydrolase (TIGR01450 family)